MVKIFKTGLRNITWEPIVADSKRSMVQQSFKMIDIRRIMECLGGRIRYAAGMVLFPFVHPSGSCRPIHSLPAAFYMEIPDKDKIDG